MNGGSTVSYTDTNVTNGTTYTYWIAAGSSNGQGTPSAHVSATPMNAPTLSATPASSSQVNLSWTSSAGSTGYHIDRSATSNLGPWTALNVVTGTTYSDTGLLSGTDYWYRVQATNAGSSLVVSNVALAQTFAGAPSGLSAAPGIASASLSWTAPSGAVGNYTLYRGTSSGRESSVKTGIAGTTYTDSGLTNGTTYDYQVTAVNEGGESAKSNEASARPPYAVPSVATAASASPNPVTGTTTTLSVSGSSAGGESALTYTWSCWALWE